MQECCVREYLQDKIYTNPPTPKVISAEPKSPEMDLKTWLFVYPISLFEPSHFSSSI
jgi:hypothetical protein